jgi:hypothetical protein
MTIPTSTKEENEYHDFASLFSPMILVPLIGFGLGLATNKWQKLDQGGWKWNSPLRGALMVGNEIIFKTISEFYNQLKEENSKKDLSEKDVEIIETPPFKSFKSHCWKVFSAYEEIIDSHPILLAIHDIALGIIKTLSLLFFSHIGSAMLVMAFSVQPLKNIKIIQSFIVNKNFILSFAPLARPIYVHLSKLIYYIGIRILEKSGYKDQVTTRVQQVKKSINDRFNNSYFSIDTQSATRLAKTILEISMMISLSNNLVVIGKNWLGLEWARIEGKERVMVILWKLVKELIQSNIRSHIPRVACGSEDFLAINK